MAATTTTAQKRNRKLMMKTIITGRRIFLLLSFVAPLLYILMYCPIWNGKELMSSSILTTILVLFQCLNLVHATIRLYLELSLKRTGGRIAFTFDIASIFSIFLTCFTGSIFALELFGIPWFPAQN